MLIASGAVLSALSGPAVRGGFDPLGHRDPQPSGSTSFDWTA
jgi:hypothetical protein